MGLVVTCPAVSVSTIDARISFVISMAVGAVSFPCILCLRRVSSQRINFVRNRLKVLWSNAICYAAQVVEFKSLGNNSNQLGVGVTVSKHPWATTGNAVAHVIYSANPKPAVLRLVDLSPKAFFLRRHVTLVHTAHYSTGGA
jgi:hypothetical protein